jgi:hypothetical protein
MGYYSPHRTSGDQFVAIRLLLIAILGSTLAACVSDTPIQSPDPMSQASAVAVAMPEFLTNENTTLRWRSDLIWVDDPEGRFERRAAMLQLTLQNEFVRKGYSFVGTGEPANYDVVAVAVLGAIEGYAELEETFRLYPSLNKGDSGYKRGSVLVALAPAGTTKIVWRGAIEMFTDPGMVPIDVREKRMQWGSMQLLSSIPNY